MRPRTGCERLNPPGEEILGRKAENELLLNAVWRRFIELIGLPTPASVVPPARTQQFRSALACRPACRAAQSSRRANSRVREAARARCSWRISRAFGRLAAD